MTIDERKDITFELKIDLSYELRPKDSQLNIRLPENLKKDFEAKCKAIGINSHVAIRKLMETFIKS